ncbi:MAG: GNAT family N-acetyltransferase [Myxococcaceae bacterium]|nr:GNAT family N-acetyltransferase [Myxococcaceae bacterium]
MSDAYRIVPTTEDRIEGFHAVLDAVARERRYLALLEAPPLEETRTFIRKLLQTGAQHLALDEAGHVVGWCDVARWQRPGFTHVGSLGMGLAAHARGLGLGRRLAEASIGAVRERGVERIELEVFASNTAGCALYERLGFVTEGVKRRARFLDGRYDDIVLMALMS